VLLILLSGFLGAGKTSTLIAGAKAFERSGRCVAAITNDQGTDLVDTQLVQARLGAADQIAGGCFCCRFDELAAVLSATIDRGCADVTIAEAVGSCTDITATVVRPLLRSYGEALEIGPVTTIVDPVRFVQFDRQWSSIDPEPDVAYLYRKQLEDAGVVAINKADRFGDHENRLLREGVRGRCSHAEVLSYSALSGAGLDRLIQLWGTPQKRPAPDPDVDYERYGRAEAELAWLNRVVQLMPGDGIREFSPGSWSECFLEALTQSCRRAGLPIGHIKVRVGTERGATKASVVGGDDSIHFDERRLGNTERALATINARVECGPVGLERLVDDAVAHAGVSCGTVAYVMRGNAFRPAQPEPVFRISASGDSAV
jgi:G3E family GTPase